MTFRFLSTTGAFWTREVGSCGCSREDLDDLEALDHGTQDGIRLDGLDLGGEELIGVVGRHARGILADDRGGAWRSISMVAVAS